MPTERTGAHQSMKGFKQRSRCLLSNVVKTMVSAAILAASSLCLQPAQAYYINYSPYGYGNWSYLAWPLTSVFYQLATPYYAYGRSMTFPFNMMNSTTGYFHSPNYWNPSAPDSNYANNFQSGGQFSYYGNSGSGSGQYPFGPGAYSGWSRQQSMAANRAQDQGLLNGANNALNPGQPGQAPLQGIPQPPFSPNQQMPAGGFVPPGSNVPGVPPIVKPPGAPFQAAPAVAGSPMQGPLSQMFVDRVNKKFKGNIKTALFDPDTRSLARAVGLVGPGDVFDADLSSGRVSMVKQIFGDPSLDPTSKLNAVRALVKHSDISTGL